MASALEQFVLSVQSLSAAGNYQLLVENMSNIAEVLVSSAHNLDNVLETFNIQSHTLGVLAILYAKHNALQADHEADYATLFNQTKEFIIGSNPEQLGFAPDCFAELCHLMTAQLVERQQPMKGILLLQTAITKIQAAPSQLTTIHADLCQLCLLGKCFKPALKVLDVDITDVLKDKGNNAKYYLLYFYYGGMIYSALKNYERAIFLFDAAVTINSMVLSHIVLESYKKRILVSLIAYGKVDPLPKWTSSVVERFARQLSKNYHELETAYTKNNMQKVREICLKYEEHFARDNNKGLVKQCLTSLYRKNIQKLTKTFLTLSLADVAQRCDLTGAQDAERHLFNMIEDGEIFAMINQKDGMVLFKGNPEKFNTPDMFEQLESNMRRYIEINERVRQLSEEIAIDPKFIQKNTSGQDEEMSSSHVGSSKTPQPSLSSTNRASAVAFSYMS